MSTLKTNNLQLLDASRNISVSKIAEMNGGFSFRNKIVDGRFDFWHESTSQTGSGYGSDTMWSNQNVGSTKVNSQQPLVAGVDLPAIDCPSAKYFSRTVVTSVAGAGNYTLKVTNIEGVNTLAGKTATLSFYAKADAVKNIAIEFAQVFGTGGSASITGIGSQLVGLSTAWKRYSVQVAIPSISGKTIAGGNDRLLLRFWLESGTNNAISASSIGQQSGTFDIACVQLEEGSIATPFEELPMEISQTRVGRYYETGPWERANFLMYTLNGDTRMQPYVYKYKKRATPVVTMSQSSVTCILMGNVTGTNSINIALTPTAWLVNNDLWAPISMTVDGYTYATLPSAFGSVLVGASGDTPTIYVDARL